MRKLLGCVRWILCYLHMSVSPQQQRQRPAWLSCKIAICQAVHHLPRGLECTMQHPNSSAYGDHAQVTPSSCMLAVDWHCHAWRDGTVHYVHLLIVHPKSTSRTVNHDSARIHNNTRLAQSFIALCTWLGGRSGPQQSSLKKSPRGLVAGQSF